MTTKPDHELPKTRSGEPRAFFGRRSGKKLHGGQQAEFDATLPELEIKLDGKLDPKTLFPDAEKLIVEIGYGGGEHLALEASRHPKTGYIGCEVFTGGIGKMVQAINAQALTNVRLYTDDALKLLMALPDASLDEVYLLYPDPWPKTRHHKRRLIQPGFVALLARSVKVGGLLHLATDWPGYASHMREVLADHAGWQLREGESGESRRPPWRIETRFERRGVALGHPVTDLLYDRVP
jgi:tRNA (guanine-N7-)-methyltransferase